MADSSRASHRSALRDPLRWYSLAVRRERHSPMSRRHSSTHVHVLPSSEPPSVRSLIGLRCGSRCPAKVSGDRRRLLLRRRYWSHYRSRNLLRQERVVGCPGLCWIGDHKCALYVLRTRAHHVGVWLRVQSTIMVSNIVIRHSVHRQREHSYSAMVKAGKYQIK